MVRHSLAALGIAIFAGCHIILPLEGHDGPPPADAPQGEVVALDQTAPDVRAPDRAVDLPGALDRGVDLPATDVAPGPDAPTPDTATPDLAPSPDVATPDVTPPPDLPPPDLAKTPDLSPPPPDTMALSCNCMAVAGGCFSTCAGVTYTLTCSPPNTAPIRCQWDIPAVKECPPTCAANAAKGCAACTEALACCPPPP